MVACVALFLIIMIILIIIHDSVDFKLQEYLFGSACNQRLFLRFEPD